MARSFVTDALWERIEPLLPPQPSHFWGGRPRIRDRVVLEGILFVLKTGIPWEDFPAAMGCSGMTCWRRLRDWQRAGVWDRLHELLLDELRRSDRLDWSRAVVDSGTVRAVGGGEKTGPNPTDRSKPGSKHHVVTDAKGVPLQVEVTAANVPDVMCILPLLVNIPLVRGKPGRPRSRPDAAYADRGYDSQDVRDVLAWLGIEPHVPKRGTPHGSGLGKYRWVVERTIGWLHNFRRLRIRFDRRADIHQAFLKLAAALVCFNILV